MRDGRTRVWTAAALLLLAHATSALGAGWAPDGAPVCDVAANQYDPRVADGGVNGVYAAWADYRNGIADIYAARLDPWGVRAWGPLGAAVCTAANAQGYPALASDGAGGVIIAWHDARSGVDNDIYAQRLDAAGNPQWAADGVLVCGATGQQRYVEVLADGAGGVIVVWEDGRGGVDDDLYAQRLDATGNALWTADGVALCTAAGNQLNTALLADGAGGAFFAWLDSRGGADIYAQHVDATGSALWVANGAGVCTAASAQYTPDLVSDGAGGVIIAWEDARAGNFDVYAQRLNAAGAVLWTADGVVLCAAAQYQRGVSVVGDDAGGAIVAWIDNRSVTDWDVYAQRVSPSGAPLWTIDGELLCQASGNQLGALAVSDGTGGAVVVWRDARAGNEDVYAQRVDATGTPLWFADGAAMCTQASAQWYPEPTSDGAGVVAVWRDARAANEDIYAQRLDFTSGTYGHPDPLMAGVSDVPADQGGFVSVRWKRSDRDVNPYGSIGYYSVWRATHSITAAAAARPALSDPRAVGPDFSGRAVIAAGDYYWEWVGNESAYGLSGYAYAAPTVNDSMSGNAGTHHFMVMAHEEMGSLVYMSASMSGYSVDNLAPAAPLMLTAQRVGGDVVLHWKPSGAYEPDLRNYAVYRATASGVTPDPVFYLSESLDTTLTDAGAPGTALYYIVTAQDVHDNEGAASNEAMVNAAPTGVADTPRLTALQVRANIPNPFSVTTLLEVGLPSASKVVLEVYDVSGRRVRHERLGALPAGWQRVSFDGRDDRGRRLPSGVYFSRISAAGETTTHKMVIRR